MSPSDTVHAQRFVRGFERALPRDVHAELLRTNAGISVLWALAYHAGIVVFALMAIAIHRGFGAWALVPCYLVSVVLIGRQLRAFDGMVHDGSHGNWCRQRPRWNDFLVNWLVAYPTFDTVDSYRQSHRIHHGRFGSGDDPCHRRYRDVKTALQRGDGLASLLRQAYGPFLEPLRRPGCIARMVAWHAVVLWLPLALWLGIEGLGLWVAFWLVPQFVALPLQRLTSGYREHDYDRAGSEADCTVSHVGLRYFLDHVHGDGYHWLHHAYPGIPLFRQRAAHRLLLQTSSQYRASRNGPRRTMSR